MREPPDPKPALDFNADARLAAIVDSSFDAIISKDLNSTIMSWNGAAERLFGYTAEEAIGMSVLMLIPPSLQSEETEIIARVRRGELLASYETTRRRKDGSLIAVSLTVSPLRNTEGEIVGASQIARDISAVKEDEKRIRLLMRELNHRVKNQFAVILSMVRETNKRSANAEEFEERIRDRIMALSRSHDLLVTSEWSGASLAELVKEHMKPFGHEDQVTVEGAPLKLQANAVQHLGMALHELGTNSAKYGALSGSIGKVSIRWSVSADGSDAREFKLDWDETSAQLDTSALASDPHRGFGSIVLQRVTPQSLSGSATLTREPGEVHWHLVAPAEMVVDQPATPR